MYAFSMWELHIYMDTHPCDEKAQSMHDEYLRKYKDAVKEFEEKFGPININNVNNSTMADWVSNPWPWDLEAN